MMKKNKLTKQFSLKKQIFYLFQEKIVFLLIILFSSIQIGKAQEVGYYIIGEADIIEKQNENFSKKSKKYYTATKENIYAIKENKNQFFTKAKSSNNIVKNIFLRKNLDVDFASSFHQKNTNTIELSQNHKSIAVFRKINECICSKCYKITDLSPIFYSSNFYAYKISEVIYHYSKRNTSRPPPVLI